MNDGMLTVSNSEFGKLNILVENGKELFPANDAAKLLGYTNPYGAVQKHCRSLLKREAATAQSLPPICRTSGWGAGVSASMMLRSCSA